MRMLKKKRKWGRPRGASLNGYGKKRKIRRNKDECEYGSLPGGASLLTGSSEAGRIARSNIIGGNSPFGRL